VDGLSQYVSYGSIPSKPVLLVDDWFNGIRADGDFGSITVGGKIYNAKHLLLVTSSLHKIDSENLEGEIMIIHELEHEPEYRIPVGTELDTVVVSVLFRTSENGYSPLWEALGFDHVTPTLRRTWLDTSKTTGMRNWDSSNLMDLVGGALTGNFYGYHGSLPVPPCFENVIYYVSENVLPVSPAQLEGLVNVLSGSGLDFNQRPVQREMDHSAMESALNRFAVTGTSTESCNAMSLDDKMSCAVCWSEMCPSGLRLSPVNIVTSDSVTSTRTPAPGYDMPFLRYHPTVGMSERGSVSMNVRPEEGRDFGILELGGRFYTAEMIQFHAVATHTINGIRYDGEIHIHHYLYGDWFNHDTIVEGSRRLENRSRRLDVFRGNTYTDPFMDVAGDVSYQVISIIPLEITTQPGGDFMSQMSPHGIQSGEKAYAAHDDLKPIFAGDFYEYQGTLIWPACSDGTAHYIVYRTPLKVNSDQIYTEYPTRSGFDTTPNIVKRTDLAVYKNHVPAASLGSGKRCTYYGKGNWKYADTHCWSEEYPNCAKNAQSPINIITSEAVNEASHMKDTFLNIVKYHPIANMFVTHTGHALQIADQMNGVSHLGIGYIEIGAHATRPNPHASAFLGDYYFLRQMHLHFPSEHVVDGHQHGAELHLVHQRQDHWGATGFDNNDILVAAIFFDVGPEESPFLKQWMLPGIEASKNINSNWTAKIDEPIDIMRALGPVLRGDYYRYDGSFTTPPCDEVVKWFVFKSSLSMSQEQYESFKAIFPNPGNNRPVRPLNGRKVALNNFEAPGDEADMTDYAFWLDRYHGRDREKPTPWVVLGGIIGGIIIAILIMVATFVPQNQVALAQSAGGLISSEPIGRQPPRSRQYQNMSDRI
jgi:carbonic anhydrase